MSNAQHEHKDPSLCAAYGCTMLGTMTSSTSGSNEWWCFLHFGKDAVNLSRITQQVRQRQWLVDCIRIIRTTYATDKWDEAYKQVQATLFGYQKDLKRKPNEGVRQWLRRLESDLDMLVSGGNEKAVPVPQPELLPAAEGPQRLQLPMPEHV